MANRGPETVTIENVTFRIYGDGAVEVTRVDPDTKDVVKLVIMPHELRKYLKVLQRAEDVATAFDKAMETWDPRR